MIPTTQPIAKKVSPLSAADYLRPGARPLPAGSFAQAMKPFTTPEIIGPMGKHVLRATEAPSQPINALDHIPGVRVKGGLKPISRLGESDRIPGVRAPAKDADVEHQAQKWVAQTFFGTLLKQMHDSPFKSEIFSGGRGGKAFEPLMDQHLAEHMARGAGKKLVRGIVKQLKGRAAKAYGEQLKPGETNPFSDLNTATGGNGAGNGGEKPAEGGKHDASPPRSQAPMQYQNVRAYVAPGLRG